MNEKQSTTLQNLEQLISSGKLIQDTKYFILSYCPPDKLDKVFTKCTFYAYILHDKDTDSNGELKEFHYHYFVQFPKAKDIYQLALDFNCGEYSFMVENVRDKGACLRYLIHYDNGEKYQYPLSDVVTTSLLQVERACRSSANVEEANDEFLKDLFRMSLYGLGRKYGRDFIKNYEKYANFTRALNHCGLPLINDDEIIELDKESFAYYSINYEV